MESNKLPLNKIQLFKVRILKKNSDGIKRRFLLWQFFVCVFFLQGVVIGSNILLIACV